MTDETGASPEAFAVTELPSDAPEVFNTPQEAAQYFTALKEKKPAAESAEPVEAATAKELSHKDNTAPDESQAPGEDEEADPAAEPPIERPRSWTEAEDAEWRATPRALQQKIVARELERDTAIRRAQNEAADERKAIKAELEAASKARQQYEANLPALMQELQSAQQNAYSDIKSMDDVVRLQAEDPFRFQAWQVHQMRLQAVKAETDRLESDKSRKQNDEWTAHINEQNVRAIELIPELADEAKSNKLRERVIKEVLPDLGFSQGELNELAAGKSKLSIYDARIQRLLADSLALRDIRNAPKVVAAKPLPPVQRPGSSRPVGQTADSERIQALNRKPELSVNEAMELYQLQQNSTRRAS